MSKTEDLLILLKSKLDSKESKLFLLLALIGIFLIGTGIFLTRAEFFDQSTVEVLGTEVAESNSAQLLVEISGAVEKTGVYTLLSNSRIENLLIASGGLSSDADRPWVEKNINRAALLKDGQKIYIPRTGELKSNTAEETSDDNPAGSATIDSLININTASMSKLDSLEGIGTVRVQKIIDSRPYSSIDELLSKKILPKSVFDSIKDKITAP